tara:strand:- start:172 stop:558 length:387 start_codon:yes stop_codon:yes gene_type:complete
MKMKMNRPTLIKIGIVILVLVAVVLYLMQQKESKTERFSLKMPSMNFTRPETYDRLARSYRDKANSEGNADKRNEYNEKSNQYELKARELREKNKERDANNNERNALNARQEASADFRSAIDRTPISC